jgi:hypothetical protein
MNLVDVLDAAVQSEALQQTPPTYVHDDDGGPVRLHALLRGISDQNRNRVNRARRAKPSADHARQLPAHR